MVVSLTRKQNTGRGAGVGSREKQFFVCGNPRLACCLVFSGRLVNNVLLFLNLQWLPSALSISDTHHTLCTCVLGITPKSP